ncbi:MAG: ABC transporter permease [Acidobacteriota bacterium]|jgi:hypothetical protein
MNHHLRICGLAATTLGRHRAKTLVVVIVYSLLVAIVASLLLYVKALRRESRALLDAAPQLVVQRLSGGRHELIPVERARAIRRIRGVQAVRPRVWGYSFDPPTGATFTLWGADSVPPGSLETVDGAGRTELEDGDCVVGRGVADERFLWVGDRLPLKGADGTLFAPRVRGVFTAASSVLTNDLVVLPTPVLRRVFAVDAGLATDLAVKIAQPSEVTTVARKIQELWPDVRTISREQILRTYDAIFDWRGGVWAAFLLSAVAAFAILVWDQGSGLSAEEYRTLGLLKAVGWSTREVMELCFWQGAIVSAVSLLTGLILAQVHLIWLDGVLFARLLRGWSVLFPPFDVRPGLDAYTLLLCLPLAVLPYVAASLLPSWRAAITDPDSILRS